MDALIDAETLPTKRLREPTMQEYLECALLYHTQNDKTKKEGDYIYLDKGVTNQDLDKHYFGEAVDRVAKRMCHRYGFKKEVADRVPLFLYIMSAVCITCGLLSIFMIWTPKNSLKSDDKTDSKVSKELLK